MIADEFDKNEIRLLAPGKAKCRICADRHSTHEPHNRNSLYYQMKFRRANGREPTWNDALADLSPLTQAYWRGELAKKGVTVSGET